MDDDKAVDVMARALAKNDGGAVWQDYGEDAQDILAAIRAAGGEVVWWKPISEYGGAHHADRVVRHESHFAILRGPEVNPAALNQRGDNE